MKELGCIIFILGIFLLLPHNVCANLNLIDNPSVEQSSCGEPVGWTHSQSLNNISVFNYNDGGINGSKSLGITVTQYQSGGEYWSFEEIPVVQQTNYHYSAQYKSTIPSKLLLFTKNSAGIESSTDITDLAKARTWTRVSIDVPVPKDAITMRIAHVIAEQGNIQLDDFLLEETKELTMNNEQNLIPNSSLEIENNTNVSLPQNWTRVKIGTNDSQFSYLNSGYSGNKSIKISIDNYTDGKSYYYFDPVSVQGGKIYDYSFFHKSDVYTEVNAEITLASGEVVYQFLGVTFPSVDWTQYKTRITMPENAVKVSLYNMLYSKGSITQDDFRLNSVTVVPFNRPIVSVTFDDSFKSFYDIVYPMFKSRELLATAYVLSGDFGSPNYITSDEFKEMYRDGFELGSHTVTHAHLPFLSNLASYDELVNSKNDIWNFTGVSPHNFASPYGEYNDTIIKQIKTLYRSHRSTDAGYNSKDNFDIFNIKTQNATNATTPEMVLEWVDTAIKNKTWLVLVYHDIAENGEGKFINTPEHLEKVLDGIKERGVFVTTVDGALDEVMPQMQD